MCRVTHGQDMYLGCLFNARRGEDMGSKGAVRLLITELPVVKASQGGFNHRLKCISNHPRCLTLFTSMHILIMVHETAMRVSQIFHQCPFPAGTIPIR
jgi:hypothetical protein